MDFSKLFSGLKCSMVELTVLFLGNDDERQRTPPRKPRLTGSPVLAKSISPELGSSSFSPPALFSARPHEVQDLYTLCILPNTPIHYVNLNRHCLSHNFYSSYSFYYVGATVPHPE